ncbi:marvel domain-containing 2 protein [Rutstroemia sp. NJR-2017a WRK4]|nr:marvel domain-containing 2 protein [Rutstroemia sp. NJR-2017a WRK4]
MNTNARRRGAKVAPSYYPRIAFHLLRSTQLISAAIVGGVMAYFMYYLRLEHYPTPWTFIVLLSISLATVAALTLTIILYNFTYLSPKFNSILNTFIAIFWMLGFGLLSWSLSRTLHRQCNYANWGSSVAINVCRQYKSVWAFTLIGTLSTLAALALDISTHIKATKKGVYVAPADDMNATKMHSMKSGRSKPNGYDAPNDDAFDKEMDIAYHNRFGEDAVESVGYHDRVFRG